MLSKKELLDLQFVDARCKLIDLAAFLDRIERHPGEEDYRLAAMLRAIPLLLAQEPGRARAVLEAFSDHSREVIASAPFQGAYGAPLPSSTDSPR